MSRPLMIYFASLFIVTANLKFEEGAIYIIFLICSTGLLAPFSPYKFSINGKPCSLKPESIIIVTYRHRLLCLIYVKITLLTIVSNSTWVLNFMLACQKFSKTYDLYIDSKRIMRIRTNKVLKFFALLLFSLEFLAPAMLVDISDPQGSQDKVQLVDGGHHQNMLYSIFTEEISENEEGREGQKDIILFTDFDFASSVLQLLGSAPFSGKNLSITSERFDTQPALFKLNCTFLI